MAVLALGLIVSACDDPNAAPDAEAQGEPTDDAGDAPPEDDAGHACPSGGDAGRSPEPIDAYVEPCVTQSGELLEPATPGTVAVTYAESRSLAPAAFSREGPRAVVGVPAPVQAETVDGLTIDCTADMGGYFCRGGEALDEPPTSELRSVSVTVGEQTWTKPVGTCSRFDSRTDFWLDGIAGCVDPSTVVLEGVLLDYPAGEAPPASVGVFGESADLFGVELDPAIIPDRQRTIPYRPCVVEGDHYACTTLGFRETVAHKLRVQVGEYIVDEWFKLEVHACEAQALRADVQACPLLPDSLQVEVRTAGDAPLPPLVASASYEAGSPYPCVEARSSTRYVTRFLCPAALESRRGEGHYEIVASDGTRSFRGVYERRSNGCVVSAGPLVLRSDEEDAGASDEEDAGASDEEDSGLENPDAGPGGGDTCEPAEQDGGPADAGRDAAREGCPELQGYIGGPLTPETIGIEGTSILPPADASRPAMLNLTRVADRVQAETTDGRTIDCPHTSRYVCKDAAGIVSVSVFVGEQSWTKRIDEDRCPPYPPEDFVHFWLDDLAWCVEPGTAVLEGTLLGYDPEGGLPISVGLIGELFDYSYVFDVDLEGMGAAPYRPCEVSGDRYRCTTIGHRTTAVHALRVAVGNHLAQDSFRLPVEECEAQLLQADVQVCPLKPLRVEIYAGDDFGLPPLQVTASHAGGAPYPCADVSQKNFSLIKSFACPAALDSDHGAGVYEVIARGAGRLLRGTFERISDGCTASDGPLMIRDRVDTSAP
jgi:hypothetical protein